MSTDPPSETHNRDLSGERRVAYSKSDDGQPFAYVSEELITTQLRRALRVLRELETRPPNPRSELLYQTIEDLPGEEEDDLGDEPTTEQSGTEARPDVWLVAPEEEGEFPVDAESGSAFFLIRGVRDPLRAVAELRLHGIVAQPNYVYFAHSLGGPLSGGFEANPVYASPVYASPVYASPVYASPVYASPVYASPVYASPVYASPVYASPVYASPAASTDAVARTSSATPGRHGHTTHIVENAMAHPLRDGARIFVLDTGLASPAHVSPGLDALLHLPYATRALRPSDSSDRPELPGENYLAPAAGHGTFIAGVISRVVPGCRVSVGKVLSNSGAGDEWTVAKRIHHLRKKLSGSAALAEHSILSLSFGAPVLDHPHLLAHVIADIQALGVVVVASAGNDSMPYPNFPAALPDVVGVGALSPVGAAPFSNYGPWVDACAPGTDLVSCFFHWHGPQGKFEDWAIWSGTSFSGPIVAASIARSMIETGSTAERARSRLIDPPWLMGIPNLGVVVNSI
jgi:Subtilase family